MTKPKKKKKIKAWAVVEGREVINACERNDCSFADALLARKSNRKLVACEITFQRPKQNKNRK